MATDEEYLDNLLKALNENEQQPRTMEEVMREVNVNSRGADSFSVTSEDLADMLEEGVITEELVKKSLRRLESLLHIIYEGKFSELTRYLEIEGSK